jgi:1-acyl-sn-glycerol-3-phosphate acyltransferase
MKSKTLTVLGNFLLWALAHMEYRGLENMPPSGGVLLTTNHLSRADSAFVYLIPSRADMTGLVSDKYKRYPFFNIILRAAGAIYIDRSRADFTAFRAAIESLKGGRAVGMAPEGTRSPDGGMIRGKPGAAFLALKSGVPILPVAITGSEKLARGWLRLRRSPVCLTIGKPYRLPSMDHLDRSEALRLATDEIMCQIAALLPESYHGVYANHPRLKELLKD